MSLLIEPEVLATLLNDDKITLLDTRYSLTDSSFGKKMYQQGHIPGAVYADLEDDLSGPVIPGKTGRHPLPAPESFVEKVQQWGIDSNSHVIIYDDGSHAMAARAWWQLNWIGIKNVSLLHGGIKAWLAGRYPLTSAKTQVSNTRFAFNGHQRPTAKAEDIFAQLDHPVLSLIDARAPERFSGEMEPLDSRAGHIPGAVCYPFTRNMDDNGRFLSPEQLRKQLVTLIDPAKQSVFYCGSGVTACHNIFAMELAGYTDSVLYPGSWSEWIVDPARPLETGS